MTKSSPRPRRMASRRAVPRTAATGPGSSAAKDSRRSGRDRNTALRQHTATVTSTSPPSRRRCRAGGDATSPLAGRRDEEARRRSRSSGRRRNRASSAPQPGGDGDQHAGALADSTTRTATSSLDQHRPGARDASKPRHQHPASGRRARPHRRTALGRARCRARGRTAWRVATSVCRSACGTTRSAAPL